MQDTGFEILFGIQSSPSVESAWQYLWNCVCPWTDFMDREGLLYLPSEALWIKLDLFATNILIWTFLLSNQEGLPPTVYLSIYIILKKEEESNILSWILLLLPLIKYFNAYNLDCSNATYHKIRHEYDQKVKESNLLWFTGQGLSKIEASLRQCH